MLPHIFYRQYFYPVIFSSSVVNMKPGDIGSTLEALWPLVAPRCGDVKMARIPSLLLSPPQFVDGQDNLLVASPTVVFWKHNDHHAHCQALPMTTIRRFAESLLATVFINWWSEKTRRYGYDKVIRCDQQFYDFEYKAHNATGCFQQDPFRRGLVRQYGLSLGF